MAMSSRTFVVQFSVGNANKGGDIAVQVQQGVHLHGGLVLPEFRPRKKCQAQVDGGRVQSIQALVEVHAERLVGVERPRDFNQDMGKLGEDAPVACFVGVGQSAARHRAAKPQVIEFPGHGSEAGFDVPQALAVSQLREGHRQVLIPVRKLPRLRMIVVTGHSFLKLLVREMGDQLWENEPAGVHPSLWKSAAEARRPSFQRLAVQIVFRSNSRHGIGLKGFAGLRKVLYRTLVFFDMIVIDESPRSIYNTYREILDYFNAIQLGLTATPRDIVDHNTFALFQCDDGLPTFAYSYEEAIDHVPPYLCDFRVLKIKTKFQDEGISKRTVSLEDQKHLILEGKEIEDINFEGSDLEKKVTNHATNALIVKEFMEESIKDPNGVLPGKTIFFCISMNHARRIEAIFDSLYPEYKGELAKVMVSDDPRVYGKGGLLDQFTRNDMPRVAISVDMLDTGIDIREIVNLVFAKPVFSYTKFWQMIGRRTRLLESNKIKPWCPEKDVFQIIDCWDNFEYFKLTPKGKEPKSQIPLPVRFAGVRIDKIEAALALGHPSVAETEIAALRAQIAAFPARSVTIMEAKEQLAQCQVEAFWRPLTAERIALLRHAVQPLFRVVSQADFKAMRFEKEILEASLAHLKDEKEKYAALTENLVVQISELPLSVNIVAQEAGLIQKAQTNHYWATMTDQSFDHLATHLDKATLRWSHFKQMKAEDMLPHVQQKVFPFIKDLNGEGTAFTRHMATAVFLIPSPNLLYGAIDEMFLEIERESREEGHLFQDIQGDVYEMLLNEISSAGKNGQFRTPRHIIKLISEVVNPQFGHNICDPACGTAGFLLDA